MFEKIMQNKSTKNVRVPNFPNQVQPVSSSPPSSFQSVPFGGSRESRLRSHDDALKAPNSGLYPPHNSKWLILLLFSRKNDEVMTFVPEEEHQGR